MWVPHFSVTPTWQEYGQGLWRFEPAEVQIGQPWKCTLMVVHDAADGLPATLQPPFPEGEDWVLVDGPTLRGKALAEGGWQSQATWTYLALQPGEHSTEGYLVRMDRGSEIAPAPARLNVLGELSAEETAPRPMAEALPAPPDGGGHGYLWIGALLIAALCAWLFLRRSTRRPPAPAEPSLTPLLRLRQAAWQAAQGRELLFAWHRDLRAVVDAARGTARSAWTDEEWIAAGPQGSGMSSELWTEWCALLSELERMKYEAHLPSRLTGEELELRVRHLAERWGQERTAAQPAATASQAPQGVPA